MCERFACDAATALDFCRFGGAVSGMLAFDCVHGVRMSVTICGC